MNFRIPLIAVISALALLASIGLWMAAAQIDAMQQQALQQQRLDAQTRVEQQLQQLLDNARLLTQNAAKSQRWKDAIQNGTQPAFARDLAQQSGGFGIGAVLMHDRASGMTYLSEAPTRPGESWGQGDFIQSQYHAPNNQARLTQLRERPVVLFAEPVWLDNEIKAVVAMGIWLDEQLTDWLSTHTGLDVDWAQQGPGLRIGWPGQNGEWPALTVNLETSTESASASYQLTALLMLLLAAGGGMWLVQLYSSHERQKTAFINAVSAATEGNLRPLSQLKQSNSPFMLAAERIEHLHNQFQAQAQHAQAQSQRLQHQVEQLHEQNRQLQKERDQAVNLPRTKSEFLSRMGEEITTPMNSMMGMLELLEKYPMSAEPKELLVIAIRAGRTLKDNFTNILDFSRMDAGLHRLQKREVALRPLVSRIANEFQHYADSKNLKLTHSINADVPERLLGDDARIAQVLGNLLGNAIRFTKEGEIGVYVDMLEQSGRKRIRFSITDTGAGIPKEAQAGLFDSLDSRSKLTNASFAGRLRLIVSKQLAELMGGEIGVSSEVGKGSRFWFTVAYEPATQTA